MPKKKVLKNNDTDTRYYFERDLNSIVEALGKIDDLPRQIKEGKAEKIYASLKDSFTIDQPGLSGKVIDQLYTEVFPGLKRPDKAVRKAREAQQEKYCRKIHELLLRRRIVLEGAKDGLEFQPDRYWQGLIPFGDLSEATMEEGRDFYRKMHSNDPLEKGEALARQLDRINRIDLSAIDINDPESVYAHLEDLFVVTNAGGGEATFVLKDIEALGPEYQKDPRVRTYLDRANFLQDYCKLVRPVMETVTSSLYPEFGYFSQPEVRQYDSTKTVRYQGEPDEENDVEVEMTLSEKYCYGKRVKNLSFESKPVLRDDGSATLYLQMLGDIKMLPAVLSDPDKTVQGRFEAFNAEKENDFFHVADRFPREEPPKTVEGTAEKRPASTLGHIPTEDRALQKLVQDRLYPRGKDINANGAERFHPALRGDAARVYRKGEDGVFVPAFPEAEKADWKGLSDNELREVLTSDGKYAYFPAGERTALIFRGGKLQKAEPSEVKLGEEGLRRVWLNAEEAKTRFPNEERIKELDTAAFDLNRVREICGAIAGSKFTPEEEPVSLQERMVKNMTARAKNDLTYPDCGKRLSEKDIRALTLLSIANPAVNGDKFLKGNEGAGARALVEAHRDAVALNGYVMDVTDAYIQRSNMENAEALGWAVSGREAMKRALTEYDQNGDPKALAQTIADGLHVLTAGSDNRVNLDPRALSEMIPAQWAHEFLSDPAHRDILEAARDYAREKGTLDRFDKALAACARMDKTVKTMEDAMEAERRLLAYENGEFRDREGSILKVTAEERKELERRAARGKFLNEAEKQHYGSLKKYLTESQKADQAEIMEDLQNKPAEEWSIRPVLSGAVGMLYEGGVTAAPGIKAVLEHEGGWELVDALTERSVAPEKMVDELQLYGALPQEGVSPETFDYDRGIREFRENHLEKFAPEKKQEFAEQKYADIAAEFGLEYEDLRDLAEARNMTVDDYVRQMTEYDRAAVENDPETRLGALKTELSKGSRENLSLEQLCRDFQELNKLSMDNSTTPEFAVECGKLMKPLFKQMMKDPGYNELVSKYLKPEDFEFAKKTVSRGEDADAILRGKKPKTAAPVKEEKKEKQKVMGK